MTEYNSQRMILKLFKCPFCLKDFKNLVNSNQNISSCPNCHYDQCNEISINKSPEERANSGPNNNNSNNSNNYQDNYILLETHSSEDDTQQNVRLFAIRRTTGTNNNEESIINNAILDIITDNIISNLFNLSSSFVLINRMPFQQKKNPPISPKTIEKLKHFKMEKKYCIKNEQDNLEFPKCTICLMEIFEGIEAILLPCEHIFHGKCITQWLKIHNTCPLCRYELSDNDDNIKYNNTHSLNQDLNNQNEELRNSPFEDVE